MNLYKKYLAIAEQYGSSKKDLMTLEYKKYIRWVCDQKFIIPTGEQTYFDKIDMELSRLYNAGEYRHFMATIEEAKRIFLL